MRETVRARVLRRTTALVVVLVVAVVAGVLVGCSGQGSSQAGSPESPSNTPSSKHPAADLVVLGKVFTSEDDKIAEAFAVKDGKYVYVGDKKGAEAFVEEGKTEVVDYTDKGLVMPSCGNGHAHYTMGFGLQEAGTMVDADDDADTFLNEILPDAVRKAREKGSKAIFGFGWTAVMFQDNMPTRQQLDAICADIPIYFVDEEGHKGLANTLALVNAGIMDEDGTVLKKGADIRGGEIAMGSDGTPSGYLLEQAGTYTRSFLDNDSLCNLDIAKTTMQKVQEKLLSEGYTMFLDGYTSYFFNDNFYKTAAQMDKAHDMHFVLGTAYEMESWMDVDAILAKAVDVKQYASDHVKTNWVKLFMDGTVEGGTGFVDGYPDGHEGTAIWTEEEFAGITRKANKLGLTMHTHAMGNKAVGRVVSAYVDGGKDELRNTIVHIHNVDEQDYKRMADHNIQVTSSMLWHCLSPVEIDFLKQVVPADILEKPYPMKSFFEHGVNVSQHTDYPALSGSPDDPFGVMEVAVTGVNPNEGGDPVWTEELVTREQALNVLTINCARQMFLEDERGSVREGKYADFLLVDKDVLSCPETEIHDTRPAATYFEGKKVYSARD